MYKNRGFNVYSVVCQGYFCNGSMDTSDKKNFYNYINYNSNCKYSESKVRYLTSCEILTEYLYNPCSIFCGKVILIEMTRSIPPIPPFPPIINDRTIFESRIVLVSGDNFLFTKSLIEENSIQYVDGTLEIFLASNKTYLFTCVMENIVNVDPFTVRTILLLDGIDISGSRNATNIADGGRVVTCA